MSWLAALLLGQKFQNEVVHRRVAAMPETQLKRTIFIASLVRSAWRIPTAG
jgi:hypothetical protein